MEEIIEKMAELEHEQWIAWASSLLPELKTLVSHHLPYSRYEEAGNCGCKTCQRIKRWERLIGTQYTDLTEEEKEQDREWVHKTLQVQTEKLRLAVVEINPKLPENPHLPCFWDGRRKLYAYAQQDMLKDHWVKELVMENSIEEASKQAMLHAHRLAFGKEATDATE